MRSLAILVAVAALCAGGRAEDATGAGPSTDPAGSPQSGPASGMHLFVLSGQSNMYHMDAGVSFTPAVEKAFGRDHVTVVKNAKRGAPIRAWDKDYQWPEDRPIPQGRGNKKAGKQVTREEFGKGFGKCYDTLMAAVKKSTEGKTYDTVTFVWMQGESDTSQKLNLVDLYVDSFNRILARIKKDLHIESMHVVIGRLSDYGMDNPNWVTMRELQVKYADEHPHCEWVNTDDLNDKPDPDGTVKNGLHYTEAGYKILGERFAEKAIALIRKK